MIYSHSRLATYENCPFKFKLKYLDKIKREEAEGVEAFLGKRVHEVLQRLYDDLFVTRENSLGDLWNCYEKLWRENWHSGVNIVRKKYNQEHYYQLGKKCIENYYQRYRPFNQSVTVGTEVPVNFSLGEDGKYKITGFIDRIAHANGIYEAHDYKTGSSLPAQKYLDEDRQLGFYQIAIEKMWPQVKEVELIWHYLAFDIKLTSRREKEDLEGIKKKTIELIETIENAHEFPATESALCNWCEYPDLCPKRKHYYIVENLEESSYFKNKGVELVNEFVKLSREKSRLEEKLNVMKVKLIDYAKKEKIEIIKGNDHKVRVKTGVRLKFPTKDTLERAALERLLKEENKWLEVSDLNSLTLDKMCRAEGWDKNLVEKVKEFAVPEETGTIFLSKLEEYSD